MQAYVRNSERPGLKRFKLSPKYQHLRSDGLARRDDKQRGRYSGHAPRMDGSFPLSHGYTTQD